LLQQRCAAGPGPLSMFFVGPALAAAATVDAQLLMAKRGGQLAKRSGGGGGKGGKGRTHDGSGGGGGGSSACAMLQLVIRCLLWRLWR
jgi:uncharacterized membrane protein YgcG